jgi:hypothetical protein
MKLSGHESRRLQELEQRLAVEDPDLASFLSTGMDEPEPRGHFSARRAPHGPPQELAGTAKAMAIALLFLVLLVVGAHVLSASGAGDERSPQCHASGVRDADCQDLRRYVPGG